MAKVGIESYLLDCHLNDNVVEIEAAYGVKGFAVLVKLWQKIYSDKGYYCEWIERSPLLFLSQWFGGNSGVDLNLINQVVDRALKIGIFDEGMYEKYSILTSRRIQKQYFDVVKRRTEINVKKEYLLLSADNFKGNVNIIEENVCKSEENVCKKSTSKVKESKDKGNIDTAGKAKYFEDKALNEAFCLYLFCREKHGDEVKGPQIALLMQQLDVLSSDVNEQISIVKKATMSNWKSFYPLKSDQKKKKASFSQRDYNYDDMEKKLMAGRDKKMQRRKELEDGET